MEDKEQNCISQFFEPENICQEATSPLQTSSADETFESLCENSKSDDEITLSQLTIKEHIPMDIKLFYNITPRRLPVSPHYVIEEEFSSNPWAMLIATIFLTKTSAKIARPHLEAFFKEYPTPYHVLEANPADLERFFEFIGLSKRAYMIWKMTYQFISAKWRRASDLCGVGKYGEDAYRIFCLGHTDVDPGDRFLRLYLDWLRGHTKFPEAEGIAESECHIVDPVLNYYCITLRGP